MFGEESIVDITFDWITRILYLAVKDNGVFSIWSLPIDNPVFDLIYTAEVLSNNSVVSTAVAPFKG